MHPVTGSRAVGPAAARSASRLSADRARGLPRMPAARPPIRSRADPEAIALLHRTARVLIDELPRLTDEVVALMREREPVYNSASIDPQELWRDVNDSLSNNVRSLLYPKETREPARSVSWRIGADRAAQGLPLDALLHGFRIGCTVVWDELVETASREDPSGARGLVHVASDIWHFVDEHCTLVSEAYHEVGRQLAWHRENRFRIIIEALLDGTARVSDFPEAEEVLGLPEQGRYAVVALDHAGSGPGALRPPEIHGGGRTVWHTGESTAHAIVLLGDVHPREVARALTVPPGARAGVSTRRHRPGLGERGPPARRYGAARMPRRRRGGAAGGALPGGPGGVLPGPGQRARRPHARPRPGARTRRPGRPADDPDGLAGRRRIGARGGAGAVLPPQHGAQPAAPLRAADRAYAAPPARRRRVVARSRGARAAVTLTGAATDPARGIRCEGSGVKGPA
ncbi:conserved hypothetical protein [Streptomyces himastatinicus ATCC 53653]|uniref:RsbT co-antagonist protein RsbRD N-terminal domain-containing protein n=1 Tax=Streptomyces himastatinicus ATCC 53653 TaxID=457427 RepID=D9WV43_9ACTN|nr:conserved hypothetical protein [Streptomyces himastatinicus ATCC 53653]